MNPGICLKTLLLAACPVALQSQPANIPAARLEPFGLQGEHVTALRFSPSPYNLYATTAGNGVYRYDPTRSDSLWLQMGLYGKKITALDIQVWGGGPAIFHTPIAGVAPDYEHGDSTLIYRLEDNHWVPSDSGIIKKPYIRSLASFASSGHEPPGTTFAILGSVFGDFNYIYASNSLSHWWKEIVGSKIGVGAQINVLAVNNDPLSREVWFAGSFEFAPWFGKSTDQGQTWTTLIPQSVLLLDNGCYSLAFDPTDPAVVYAGTARTVMKTTDGGKAWRPTGMENNRTYIYGLAVDYFDPNHVYAGSTEANRWAMWESFNGGTNWQEIPASQSSPGITSIVADPNESGVVYIGTLGGGVWRYQSDVVAVQDRHEKTPPKDFVLEQNYPNPFTNSTTMELRISRPMWLEASVFDLNGKRLRTLLASNVMGARKLFWDGTDARGRIVPAGIYWVKVTSGQATLTRKVIFLK